MSGSAFFGSPQTPGIGIHPVEFKARMKLAAGDSCTPGKVMCVAFNGGNDAVTGGETTGLPGSSSYAGNYMRDVVANNQNGGIFGIALGTVVADSGDTCEFLFRGRYGGTNDLLDAAVETDGITYSVSNGTTVTMVRGEPLVPGTGGLAGELRPLDDASGTADTVFKVVALTCKGRAAAGGAVLVSGTIPVWFNGVEGWN